MSLQQNVGLSRWHFGLGAVCIWLQCEQLLPSTARFLGIPEENTNFYIFFVFLQITGAIYYFTNSANRQNFQNYVYHTISNVFSELGHMNIMFVICVCIISIIKFNYNLFSGFSVGSIRSRTIINAIFISLRFITALKVVISVLRAMIKARKYTKFENQASKFKTLDIRKSLETLNNKCIICLNEFSDEVLESDSDSDEHLVLECQHIFHPECFKQWYYTSGSCPYCREKVEI